MTLNHLNLVVTDVAATRHLFETYFHFSCTVVKGDNAIAILKGSNNFTLVIMKGKENVITYPQAFHIGFMLPDKNAVIETYQKLKAGGMPVGEEPRNIRDSFGFYFTFDGVMIEVAQSADK